MQTDDDLTHFAAQGAPPLPPCTKQGDVEHDGARIWYAAYGADPTVILLHGGLGHAATGVSAADAAGRRVRRAGHRQPRARAQHSRRPAVSCTRMADDLLAVMDALRIRTPRWRAGAMAPVLRLSLPIGAAAVDGVFLRLQYGRQRR